MKVLVTGAAGFIGFHLTQRLLAEGHEVLGLDSLLPAYEPLLAHQRLTVLRSRPGFSFVCARLEDADAIYRAANDLRPDIVVHLAAQAGVRRSLSHATDYVAANVAGTSNLLEALRPAPPRHFLFASTSSIYGERSGTAFRETDRTDQPVSPYAATKKAVEVLTHSWSHLYCVPTTCFRFFTVYGPWGRPDMALFRFVDAIEKDEPIELYGEGRMERDFTFVGDLVEAVRRLMDVAPVQGAPAAIATGEDSLSEVAPWRTVNIGQGKPVGLLQFVAAIEAKLGKAARVELLPVQPGDVRSTWADPGLLRALTGFVPSTSLEHGVSAFVDWYREWRANGPAGTHMAPAGS